MTQAKPLSIPPGFAEATMRGPFTRHNGPVYRATAAGDLRTGLCVLDRHCNGMGFLHGGMVSSFADSALAWGVWSHTGRRSVTLKLTVSFLETVYAGDWIEADPEMTFRDEGFVHLSTAIKIDGERIAARADGVFRLLRPSR